MAKHTTTPEAYDLLHRCQVALAEIEDTGIRVDRDYLERSMTKVARRVKEYEADMRADPIYRTWRRRYGEKTKLTAPEQLAGVVFGELGYTPRAMTDGGATGFGKKRAKADEASFEGIDIPFVKTYFKAQKLRKGLGTYLRGIHREMVPDGPDWFVHPSYNLNTVVTFRSSCVAAGTMVEIVRDVAKFPKGMPIEDVCAGDYAYTYDDNLRLTLRKVLWAGKTGHRQVVRVHWSARGKKGHLDVTPEHRIRLVDGTYVEAQYLQKGQCYRPDDAKKHSYRIHALAMGRTGHRLYETGNTEAIFDHRLVYESLIGPLAPDQDVHHKDLNHFNNNLDNLETMTRSDHAVHHAKEFLTDDVRRMGVAQRVRNHAIYGDRWPSGEDAPGFIPMSKFGVLRLLSRCGGSATAVRDGGHMDFDTFKKKAKSAGVDLKNIRVRYDRNGKYISRGRLRAISEGKSVGVTAREIGKGYYPTEKLMQFYGITVSGGRKVNNHCILDVEWLPGKVDVYDLQIEGTENFIAGELCVHNCSDPNFQNIPTRNKMLADMIRRCYIPRRGRQFVEIDYSQIEVKISYCYHRDPTMGAYLADSDSDMHRDLAARVFFLDPHPRTGNISKDVRHVAKNKMTFPQFYGDFYIRCAQSMWNAIGFQGLKTGQNGDGTPLYEHLAKHGITSLGECDPEKKAVKGTFEYHVQEIERWMWEEQFPVYTQWKKDWWNAYRRDGGFMMKTGFAVNGPMSRNEVNNSGIQGSAFHCLAWSMPRVVDWLRTSRMESRCVGEIHDCLLLDVHPAERDDVIYGVRKIMTQDIMAAWDWIITPLEIEAECCPIDAPWLHKRTLVEGDGTFVPKDMDDWKESFGEWNLQVA